MQGGERPRPALRETPRLGEAPQEQQWNSTICWASLFPNWGAEAQRGRPLRPGLSVLLPTSSHQREVESRHPEADTAGAAGPAGLGAQKERRPLEGGPGKILTFWLIKPNSMKATTPA